MNAPNLSLAESVGLKCAECVGLPLKITHAALGIRLAEPLAAVERHRRMVELKAQAKAAADLRKALQKARAGKPNERLTGLSSASVGVDLDALDAGLRKVEQRAKARRSADPLARLPGFISQKIAAIYVHAFDRKPGRSQSVDGSGKAQVGGPFVAFTAFILADLGEQAPSAATIARYIGGEREVIDKVWRRHELRRRAST